MILLDLVTIPLTEISLFMSSGFKSLITFCSFKLNGLTCNRREALHIICLFLRSDRGLAHSKKLLARQALKHSDQVLTSAINCQQNACQAGSETRFKQAQSAVAMQVCQFLRLHERTVSSLSSVSSSPVRSSAMYLASASNRGMTSPGYATSWL